MKIAFCITRMDEFGGAQVHLRDLSLWLHAQGHQIVILSGNLGVVSDEVQGLGIECIEIPSLQRSIHPVRDMRAFKEIRQALLNIQPDIVACHSSKAGLLGRLSAKLCGYPTVFTAHGWAFTVGVSRFIRIVYWMLEKIASYFTDTIITVSQFDRNLAIRSHISHPRNMIAIHNGMPVLPVIQRKVRDTPIKLIMVARIGAQKDHARLLRVLWGCMDTDWTLDLVGGGDDTHLRHIVDKMGMGERVSFLGERSDVTQLLEKADLFLLITHWEGLPLSILEAMRSGLPVLSSQVGGVSEAVIHNQTGWVVPPENDTALLEILHIALKDKSALLRMGQAGRARFEEKFTFDTMAQKTLLVYINVLNNRACRQL